MGPDPSAPLPRQTIKTAESCPARNQHAAHTVRHAGILIHQHALDLDQEPSGLLSDIERVAARLMQLS